MKNSGKVVKHRKTGKIGKIYNSNPVMNDKCVVYFYGEENATLCKAENLQLIGYFD